VVNLFSVVLMSPEEIITSSISPRELEKPRKQKRETSKSQ